MKNKALSLAMAATLMLVPAFGAIAQNGSGIITLPPLRDEYSGPVNDFYGSPNTVAAASTQPGALRGRISTVPQGTMLVIKLDQPVSSFSNHVGDQVAATLENDIFVNDAVAIPAGSQVLGQVANVKEAGHMGKHGTVDVRFHAVRTPDGQMVPLSAHVVTTDQSGVLKGDTYKKDVLKGVAIAGGGAGVGTLMGLSAGALVGAAGAGALVGLSAGALGGMGYAMVRKGKEVVVPAGSRMSIMVDQPMSVNI